MIAILARFVCFYLQTLSLASDVIEQLFYDDLGFALQGAQ